MVARLCFVPTSGRLSGRRVVGKMRSRVFDLRLWWACSCAVLLSEMFGGKAAGGRKGSFGLM